MTKSVLVIDDDPRICQLIAVALERKGYEVIKAANGRAGLKAFETHRPDLVITDILMPEMEGIQTIMEMKKSGRAPKIIAISGGGRMVGREFLKWARHLGADEVMAKPFRVSALVAMARQLTHPQGDDRTCGSAQPAPLHSALRGASDALAEGWDSLRDRGAAFMAA